MAKTRRKLRPVTLPPGFNGDIDLQMVDMPDPFEPSKTIRIVKNTRTHPLDHLHAKGQITDAQLAAGNRFLQLFEDAEIGGARAIDYERVKVDISFQHAGISPDVARAIEELKAVERSLGKRTYLITRMIIGQRITPFELAREKDRCEIPSRRTREYFTARFRDILDELADHFGSARGPERSTIRVVHTIEIRA